MTRLVLLGWVQRSTQDIDVIAMASAVAAEFVPPDFPTPLVDAIERVARDEGLSSHWLNDSVASQWRSGLPPGIGAGIEWRHFGSLHIGLVGRHTILALKLFAAADRGPRSVHCRDLIALEPSDAEFGSGTGLGTATGHRAGVAADPR